MIYINYYMTIICVKDVENKMVVVNWVWRLNYKSALLRHEAAIGRIYNKSRPPVDGMAGGPTVASAFMSCVGPTASSPN